MRRDRHILRFGLFEADLETGELWRRGLTVPLQEQPWQVLSVLLDRGGGLVTRDELTRSLWPEGHHVDAEHGLNAAVNKLRDALGDSAANPRFIETVRRRGYRFLAPVHASRPSEGSRGRELLAALPFESAGGEADLEDFADGLTEEMMTRLGGLAPQRLAVIARTSVQQFKGRAPTADRLGEELGVDHVLQGVVRRSGERVRVSAQLVATADQTLLWAESYEHPLTDVFTLQRQITEDVAGSLARALLGEPVAAPSEPLPAPAARRKLLEGLRLFNERTQDSLAQALVHFRRAVEADPGYAAAHAALAGAHNMAVEYGLLAPQQGFSRARTAAEHALGLAPGLAEAHAELAFLRHRWDWDWDGAEAAYDRALELNSNLASVHRNRAEFLSQMGRHVEALEGVRQARRLDPLSRIVGAVEGWLLYHARRFEEAAEVARRICELDPRFPVAAFVLGRARLQQGRSEEAVEACRRAVELSGGSPFTLAGLGVACAASDRRQEAQVVLAQLTSPGRSAPETAPSPFLPAKVHLHLGGRAKALDLLEEACETRSSWMVDLGVDPELDPLRPERRFRRLLARMRLPG
ncbi:MAG: tetratricopeptide repeat protein [bacterium]|nr:tetratricopeptide repeat protein [bacterium]